MTTAFLLDTHVLLWLVSSPKRIPPATLALLHHPSNTLVVSSVVAMEMATKNRLGKMENANPLIDNWDSVMKRLGADETPLTRKQALTAGLLDWAHRDPFDRMLAAQAINLNISLVTKDVELHALDGLRVQW